MNNNLKEVIEFFKNKYKAKKGDILLILTEEDIYLCKLRTDGKVEIEKDISGNKDLLMLKQSEAQLTDILDYASKVLRDHNIKMPDEESLQPKETIIITSEDKYFRCFKLTPTQFNVISVAMDLINSALKQGYVIKKDNTNEQKNNPKNNKTNSGNTF